MSTLLLIAVPVIIFAILLLVLYLSYVAKTARTAAAVAAEANKKASAKKDDDDSDDDDDDDRNHSGKRPKFFTKCNYSGYAVKANHGNYPTMRDLGVYNYTLSSLRVPRNYTVTLYEFEHYRGRSITFTKNVSCLRDFALSGGNGSWDNIAQSVSIRKD